MFMMPASVVGPVVRNVTQRTYSKLCRDINAGTITLTKALEYFPELPEEDNKMDFEKYYTCPDCGDASIGYELIYNNAEGTLYVCPHCGVIQEEQEVERQLKDEEE